MKSWLQALAVVLFLATVCAPAQCFASCSASQVPPCHRRRQHSKSVPACSQQQLSAVLDRSSTPQLSTSDLLSTDFFSCIEPIPVVRWHSEREAFRAPPLQRAGLLTVLRI